MISKNQSISRLQFSRRNDVLIHLNNKFSFSIDTPENIRINEFVQILESCTQSKTLPVGKKAHCRVLRTHIMCNKSLIKEKIMSMYIACEKVELARNVFDTIQNPSTFTWNSMIRAYAWIGPFHHAINLYNKMTELKIAPNKFTFPFVLKACAGLQAIEDGKRIHDHAKKCGLDKDIFIRTGLIDFYVKCDHLNDALLLFDKMPNRDVVAWNAMIAGFSQNGLYEDAIGLIFEMQNSGFYPNQSTIVALLPVLGMAKALIYGKALHGYSLRRYLVMEEVLIATAFLDMYAKCRCLNYAEIVFAKMNNRNEVTWSAIIGAYVTCGQMENAINAFDEMFLGEGRKPSAYSLGSVLRACAALIHIKKGQKIHGFSTKSGLFSDITVGNSLLSLYAKSGAIVEAIEFFNEMKSKDTVSYSAIITGSVQNGNAEEALLFFSKMLLDKVEPDLATMAGVIPACAQLSALQHGRCSHGFLIVRGLNSDISMGNALIDMYSKCGRIDTARVVFDRMNDRDIVSWNSMISGYGSHGLGSQAISLFLDLQTCGIKPDDVTFICLLSACSHSGLVTEGKHWFSRMKHGFGIVSRMEHYICMVDLLGRAGFLDEAHHFIKSMPFKADVRVWGALLGACRIHGHSQLAEETSKIIHDLGPEGTGNFVLLSNIYSAAGRWDDAANVRIIQRERGYRKSPGCSWIEIHGNVHAFIGGDRSHPFSKLIYKKLDELLWEMKKLGYNTDNTFVLHDVEDEEKERVLLYHSEKLAIAFGIISLSSEKPIFVTKNLRVCGDCHNAIKFITLITKREITVRDANRFHHFKDGTCNCRDFW